MARMFQESFELYFLFGSGSNQHNQLLLKSKHDDVILVNGEDVWELNEIVLCTKRESAKQIPKMLLAGGGHCGLLTETGLLYLWGWNQHGQLGSSGPSEVSPAPIPCISPLRDMHVEQAALGFSHTLVIEKETGRLFAFGDNSRGQVDGTLSSSSLDEPVTLNFIQGDSFIHVAAGLFHSAAITTMGEAVTFGCGRFGQCVSNKNDNGEVWAGRWRPDDGSRLVRVACGRRHTVLLDEHGRVWTLGDNKYGQLGRAIDGRKFDGTPQLVRGILGKKGSGCFDIDCGWSHTVARVRAESTGSTCVIYGWGRNDRGQLGTGSADQVSVPIPLFNGVDSIQSISCGSESTMLADGTGIMGCGWNEHGNLALGNDTDSFDLKPVMGARVISFPPFEEERAEKLLMAAGGAHFLVMKIK
jgi:alpha-tubulin suppressor-like RCC1 family protein